MTIHTCMPLELVLDGFQNEPAPMVEVRRGELTMLLAPVAPGVGRIVRLLSAPLDIYLQPEYAPGSLVYYGTPGIEQKPEAPAYSSLTDHAGPGQL
ncbi:YlzJ-like family protein [Cohnella lubricantis]|uniref:YlzJ-like family protein n=1 Tax=Cohnella lubricantis TaxID=2163172 RepID=A0A841TKC5_9BACL|nr:YlzJ-like family protein [Cohnella lubricantis]MBB6679658.1 YlzJ-like family protein [Cohnella lubricantis]MBP2119900.1 hypothetical protein [Cohnella lubricantis]